LVEFAVGPSPNGTIFRPGLAALSTIGNIINAYIESSTESAAKGGVGAGSKSFCFSRA
jgi:hypothetical protein